MELSSITIVKYALLRREFIEDNSNLLQLFCWTVYVSLAFPHSNKMWPGETKFKIKSAVAEETRSLTADQSLT